MAWNREGAGALLEVLKAAGEGTPVWNWSPDPADLGGTLGIACDDVPGEWLIRLAGTESTETRGSADGDAVVHGRASDVLLFLYNRVAVSRVAVRGDESIVQRWTTHVRW